MWRDQIRRPRRKRKPPFTCSSCGRPFGNPLTHDCKGGGGIARRRRSEQRKQATAARRARERERIAAVRKSEKAKADKRVAAAKAKRKRSSGQRERHDYYACRDADCERTACEAWREGITTGDEQGYQRGFDDGVSACPREHSSAS